MNNGTTPHRIIIVGGGAGGLELATKLGKTLGKRGRAEVTLVDNKLTHIWKPLLHEVAAGTLDSSVEELEYMNHAHMNHFKFRLGSLDGLDRTNKEVHVAATHDDDGDELIPARSFPYDTLVIAIGSLTNHFNIPGVEEHCYFLDTLREAEQFRKYLLKKLIKAQTRTQELREGELSVAIAGAGATGVELSAELYDVTEQLIAYGMDNIEQERDIKITILEAAPTILPALPAHLSSAAAAELEKLGIELLTDQRIVEANEKGFTTQSGEFIPAEIKVWAAGVKAAEVLSDLDGLETNQVNQLVVKPTLQTTVDDSVFAFGDCAACPMPNGEGLVPPRAQAAHQQASLLAKSIKRRMAGKELKDYKYLDYGSLVNLGRFSTVGNLMGSLAGRSAGNLRIEGLLAKFIYKSLHTMHLIALHGYVREILVLIANKLTGHGTKPRVKLH